MKKYNVLLFAVLAEIADSNKIEMELSLQDTKNTIIDKLIKDFPAVADFRDNLLVSVNGKNLDFNQKISGDNLEIAIFPPVSGG